ncbi:MAG: amino acid permease, partial [Planctomycetota bacterium]
MISSGLFVLPGVLYGVAGPGMWVCYVGASVVLVPALFAKAELATALPKAGGDYFHIDRSIGPRFGMLGGVATWASLAFKTAFALIGLGAFARLVWPGLSPMQTRLIALGFCAVFTMVNVWSARHAGLVQMVLVVALLALIGGYVAVGLPRVEAAWLGGMLSKGPGGLVLGAAMVFVSFGGLTKAASVAEEVKAPGRNLPLGMFAAFAVVTVAYVAVVFVTVGVVSGEELTGPQRLAPISLGGRALLGRAGLVAMSVAAVLAFVSTGNAGILAASRAPMAMSRDGLLPGWFGRVSERRGTPHWAVLFTGAFIGALLFMDITLFVKSASAMKILLFAFSIVSLILMRESRVANYAPAFRSPGYPWLHVAGLVAYVFLLVELGSVPLLVAGGILGCGLVWYTVYARRRVARDSALVHLAKRVASRFFESHDLEAELAEIVLQRDGVVEDRFDRLVRDCAILDLPPGVTRDDLFATVADHLAPHLDMDHGEIQRLLTRREEATSTVIRPGLAIPHIVIPGEGHFEILLARSREGVTFAPGQAPVHAMFVLIGSQDQRPYHLRALMAVAEVAQSPDFDRRWLDAPGAPALRRLVLNAKRRRHQEEEAGGQLS